MAFEIAFEDGLTVSDDRERFDLHRGHRWIAEESYWAKGMPFEVFEKAIANSLAFGAYAPDGEMTAMARVVTDRATFGWLGDVFVDEAWRGQDVGKRLMDYFKQHPDLQGFRRMHLATADAHGLYAQYGFGPITGIDRWMEILDREVYQRGRGA